MHWLLDPLRTIWHWWYTMKLQIPDLKIEGVGIMYVYPIFLVFLLMEFFNAKHLYNLRETFASFIILVGATVIRVITNVFEVTLYMFLFWKTAELRQHYL